VTARVLRDDRVWNQAQRNPRVTQIRAYRGRQRMPLAEASPGIVLGTFCERVWEAALAERAPFVSEWHIARVLNEYHSADLQQVFVRPENLLARVGELIGMESSSESD